MTHSSLTNGVQLTSDSSARNSGVDRFIVHHAATTSLAAILALFQPGGREVSANYALGNDGTLILAVDEDRRAWTSSSAYWDGRAVTIEAANSVAGGSWPVSDVSFDKLARLIADVGQRYGFYPDDNTVLTHQELYTRYGDSYATSCPGDLQRRKGELVALAQYYYNGGGTPTPPKEKEFWEKGFTMGNRQYYARIDAAGNDNGEWMIAGTDIGPHPTDPKQDGYRITTDKDVARIWARQYGIYPPETKAVRLYRDDYVKQQEFARADAAEWRAFIRSLVGG